MAVPRTLPAQGSTSWYGWAQDVGTALGYRPQCHGVPLYARGTSYTFGANATAGNDFVTLVAAALGSTSVKNAGLGGSNTVSYPYEYIDSANAWTPGTSTGLVLIEAGIGESLSESTTVATWQQQRDVFANQIATALRWHRAKAVRRMDHATITRGAGVTYENFSVSALTVTNGAALQTGESFSITLAESALTEIALLTIPWRNSAASENGVFRYRVDGGAWRTDTTVNKGDPRPDAENVVITLRSTRVSGLTGTSTIEVEQVSGKVLVYGYLLLGNLTPPPIVLVQDVPLIEVGGMWDFPGGEVTENAMKNNATLEKYREILRRVATSPEFADGTVAVGDPAARWDPATNLASDQIHPNDAGHALYRDAILAAVQAIGR